MYESHICQTIGRYTVRAARVREIALTRCWLAALTILYALAIPLRAAIVDSAGNGFTVKIAIGAQVPAATAYRTIVDVASWWDPDHPYSGTSSNLSIDAVRGGCFCEKLANGGGVRHLAVVYADPGKRLRMNGGLGPMEDMAVAGSLSFDRGSRRPVHVTLTYTAGGYLPGGLDAMAKPADAMLTCAMQRLERALDGARPWLTGSTARGSS
jgi:hypothetical protein